MANILRDEPYGEGGGGGSTGTAPGQTTTSTYQTPVYDYGRYQPIVRPLEDAYLRYLGRSGSTDEIMSHVGYGRYIQPQNIQWALQQIQNSPEARAYAARQAANTGGTLQSEGGGSSSSGGDYTGFTGGSSGGGTSFPFGSSDFLFDDPSTALFEDILKKRLQTLGSPLTIPGLDQYISALNTRMGQLSSPLTIPEVDALKAAIAQRQSSLGTGPAPNPELQKVLEYASQRMAQLQEPPFSPIQEKTQEVQAFDQLERDKQAARQQIMERLGARGIGAGSGILEAAIQQSDRAFDQMRQQRTTDLALYRTEEGERRKGEALNVGTLAATMRQAELDRQQQYGRENIELAQQAAEVAQSQALLDEQRSSQIVNLAAALADVGFQTASLNDSRGLQQLQTAALLPDLVERRLQLALGALSGGSTSLAPFGSQLMGLLQQSGYNRVNAPVSDTTGLFAGLGSVLGLLAGGRNGG